MFVYICISEVHHYLKGTCFGCHGCTRQDGPKTTSWKIGARTEDGGEAGRTQKKVEGVKQFIDSIERDMNTSHYPMT